jgi:hypothetical protein
LLATTIIVSRKLVNMGRKFYLFVYYAELIDTKLWMAKEDITLNGIMESRTMEGRIRRGISKQCKQVFLLSSSIFKR